MHGTTIEMHYGIKVAISAILQHPGNPDREEPERPDESRDAVLRHGLERHPRPCPRKELRMRIYNGFRVSINPQLPPRTWRLIGPRSLECSADLAKELAGLKQDKAKAT